jgi:hypothetical protein
MEKNCGSLHEQKEWIFTALIIRKKARCMELTDEASWD